MDTYDLILPHKAVLAKGKNLVINMNMNILRRDIKKLELVVLSKYPDYRGSMGTGYASAKLLLSLQYVCWEKKLMDEYCSFYLIFCLN